MQETKTGPLAVDKGSGSDLAPETPGKAPIPTVPEPDAAVNLGMEQAATQTETLWLGRSGYVYLAAKVPGSRLPFDWLQWFFEWPQQSSELLNRAAELAPTKDVYIGVLPHDDKDGKRESCQPSYWLWADIDRPCDQAKLDELGAMVVESGTPGHLQVYPRLASALDWQTTEVWNRRLAKYLDADPSGSDAGQVLRLAGTTNHKSNGGPVRLIRQASRSWTLEELERLLRAAERAEKGSDDPLPEQLPELDAQDVIAKYEHTRPRLRDLFETTPEDGKWSDALWKLSLELVDAGATRPERFSVLKASGCNKADRDAKGDGWFWQHFVLKPEEKQAQSDEKALQEELKRLRVRERAREILRAEKEADRYREPPESRNLAQELANRPEPIRWAIPDWVPEGGNVGIEAKKKTGKTTLMGNVTKCLVDHLPFLGNQEWLPRELDGNVGYCNLELPAWQFLDWLEDMGIRSQHKVIPWHLRGRRMPMNVDVVIERYINWLTDHDIEVWILDPRNRAWQGMVTDENNNSQVNDWSAQVDYIKQESGVRECYIPAHMGHENERGRGASAWGDWLDAIWTLTADGGTRFLSAPDGRDVAQPKRKLLYDHGSRRLTVGEGSLEDLKRQRRIRSVIAALRNTSLNTRQLRDTMRDCQKDDRSLAIREAIEDGYVATIPEGQSTMHYLTLKGESFIF